MRPREPESETASGEGKNRDPLREAVAAWVATSDAEADGSADKPKPGAGSSGRVDSESDSSGPDSGRTAVSRAPKPDSDGSDSDSDSDSASAGEPASAAAKPGSASASAKGGTDAPASAAAKPAAADASAGKPDSGSASAKGDSEATAEASAKGAADSERTAVFRAVKPGSASASASAKGGADVAAEASAKGAADSERTAVFRAVKPGSGTGAPAPAAEKPVDGDRSPAGGSGSGAAQASAKPGSGSGDAKGNAKDNGKGDTPGSSPAAVDAGDSERTAVFRAPKLDSVSGAAKAPAAGKASDESADSERTAVFRAVKPDSASGGAKAAPAAAGKPAGKPAEDPGDSERTAVFRAVKPGTKAPAPAPASESASASAPEKPVASRPVPPKAVGGERASTFVPLRKDGGPAAAKPAASAPAPAPAAAAATPVVPERTERTTQQPLPPKPPLDMLADLTNNPPPPPSALRTATRRFKIYAPLVVLLAIILAVVQLVRPMPEPKLRMTAKASYTFDGGNPVLPWPKEGQAYMAAAGLGTVGSFGEQKPIAIGSVAKTMTAYVILKNHPLKKGEKGPMIDIDKTAVDDGNKDSDGESTVNTLKAGDKISEYDALAAIMIPSANNVARLLARWDSGGDQEAFVKKMNEAAKDLGMTNTTYTDPSGLDATTVSTAEDQVKLGLKVVEMPELIAITKLPSWTDPSGKPWRNWNDLVPFNGAVGLKTGSTTKAGGNLLFAAEKKVGKTNQLIVGAVLGQHGVPILGTAIGASKNVMLATQKMLVNATVVKKGDVVGYVDDGLDGRTPVVATADVEAVGWPSLTVDIKLADGDAKLPQTAKAGTEIGVLTVGEGASQVKVPVALQSDLVAPGIGSKLTRVG
ncbi:hypothetical protein AB0I68_17765 [Streptomyces sp. NPDC050448]|uniref:D-alanyl-D-alanine carboxypeptidase n=1 Tax=Streptomyces sp. NPDC050448 TaxID=3155404 RepID=UPI00343C8091